MPDPAASRPPSPSSGDREASPDGELHELRQLMFGPELAQISQLYKRLDDPEMRAQDVSQVLSRATVRRTLEQLIVTILKREPEVVVESIRPVLLIAVRKAVTDAFRDFTESLNQIAEKSLSLRSLRWRFEAFRTGRNFSDIMLSRSLLYSVREVFLIHGKTGIMLNQAAREAVTKDADMISSMFTAIQEFVRDSFIGSENTELETIDAGSLKLWIQHGPNAMVAGAVDGTPPLELKGVFRAALNEIQANFGNELRSFQGDVTPFQSTRPILEKCLLGRSAAKSRKPVMLWLLAALCVVLLAAWATIGILSRQRWTTYVEKLEKQPGIVVTRVEKQGPDYVVFGLRDELAQNPAALLGASGIPVSKVKFRLEPYHSLDPAFAAARQFREDQRTLERLVIRFPQGDAELSPDNLDSIDAIAATVSSLLRAAPRVHPGVQIEVIGHTDEIGSGESNSRLSSLRADRVKAALVAAGINTEALIARGVATSQPVRQGSSDRDRSFNRSVTLRVVQK